MGFGKPSALHVIDSGVPRIALSSFGSVIQRGGTKFNLIFFCYCFIFETSGGDEKGDENFLILLNIEMYFA